MGSFGTGIDGQTAGPDRSEPYLLALIHGDLQNGPSGGGVAATNVKILGANGATSSQLTGYGGTGQLTNGQTGTIPPGTISVVISMDSTSSITFTGGIATTYLGTQWVVKECNAPPGAPYPSIGFTATVGGSGYVYLEYQ